MKFLIVALFVALAVTVQAKNETRRVYGGTTAAKFQFPYQVGILLKKDNKEHLCGGSLISSTRVLTAAHCFENVEAVLVVLGARIVEVEEKSQVTFNVPMKRIYCHPQFDHYTLYNDIAMIKLPSAVEFNDYISPIALPEGTNDFVGDTGVVSGWGHFDETAKNSFTLRFANLKIISNSKCSERVNHVIESTMCAKGQGLIDGCHGDSGGPLAVQINGKATLVGVQSFVLDNRCGTGTGFSRVTSYMSWIESNM